MTSTMNRHADLFKMFGSFAAYIEHFHLGDFVDANGVVRFLLPFDNFESPWLPSYLPTYARYRLVGIIRSPLPAHP